jgi:F-type H+-transporting ATPase subunit a
MEHELWFTAILNKLFGGPVDALLARVGTPAASAAHPIPNYIAMELLAALVILTLALLLRGKLSVESPGTLQQAMESVVEFVANMNEEIIGHGSERYLAMIGTLGLFILLCNIMGLIPTLGTPTGRIEVTLGCAVAVFIYYNYQAVRHNGVFGYVKHLWGPVLLMGFLMFPIEVFGNLFRMLSLSVRLYANMFVGDVLESVFTGLVPVGIPALFMALHLFVSALQAYIFMLLPAVYISLSTSSEH